MKKFLKVVGYVMGAILILIIGVVIFLQSPPGKNLVRKQVVSFLEKKFKTPVIIDKIDYRIPSMVSLEGVILVDKKGDTLMRLGRLEVDIAMIKLLSNKLAINNLELDGLSANIYRNNPDTLWNYNYIIDAFAKVDTAAPTKDKDTSATSMLFDINRVSLKNINLVFNDNTGGMYFDLKLDSLLLKPKEIDPTKMTFRIKDLILYNAKSQVRISEDHLAPKVKDTTAGAPILLSANNLDLQKINFSFTNQVDSMYFGLTLGALKGKLDLFDLAKRIVNIGKLQLSDTRGVFAVGDMRAKQIVDSTAAEAVDSAKGWIVHAPEVLLKNLGFKFDDNNKPEKKLGMDYAHLDISNLSLTAANILYSQDSTSGELKHLAMNEKSGFQLLELRTQFAYFSKGAYLKDLYVLTPNTLLQDNVAIQYESIESLSKNLGALRLNINLVKSKVAINDVLVFTPVASRKTLLPYAGQSIKLGGNISGRMDALQLKDVFVAGLKSTELLVNGSLRGLPTSDKLAYDLAIDHLKTSYADIRPFVPASVQQQVSIPNNIAISGRISGTIKDYSPNLSIRTSDGDAKVAGFIKMSGGKGRELYNLNVSMSSLNIGKILRKDTLLGTVSLNVKVNGSGFDPKYMNANVVGDVHQIVLKGYNYHNLSLKGDIAAQQANISMKAKDPNADFVLLAQADLRGKNPAVVADLDITQLNPYALGLVADTLALKGNIKLSFTDLDPDRPTGYFSYVNPQVFYKSQYLSLDSIFVRSNPKEGYEQDIDVNVANILTAKLTGSVPLTQIGNVYMSRINQYFTISDTISKVPNQYDFKLDALVKYNPIFKSIVPELKPFDSVTLASAVNPAGMTLNLLAPRIVYGTNAIDSLVVAVKEEDAKLKYGLDLVSYKQVGGSIKLFNPTINGYLANDTVNTFVKLKDSAANNQYAISTRVYKERENMFANLYPNLMLNYDQWDVNQNNLIAFGPQGFYVNDFSIVKGNQSIKLNSKTPSTFKSPIDVLIKDFELENITRILGQDSSLASGQLNLNGNVDLADSFPKLDMNLALNNLSVYETMIGKITAKASNDNSNTYNLQLALKEQGNDMELAGRYNLKPVNGNNLDFNLNANALSLKSLQGLTFGAVDSSAGFIRGKLSIKGETKAPQINGQLTTDQLATNVKMLNMRFTLPAEKIAFNNNNIVFRDFTINDRYGKSAKINGDIQTQDFKTYVLGLKVKADRWTAMNSTKEDNEQFYGKMVLSTNLSINGGLKTPAVTGNVIVHDSTNFTFANVDKGPAINDHEGIVKFVNDVDSFYFNIDSMVAAKKETLNSTLQLNVNAQIDKAAKIRVVVDPLTGDNLLAQGDATINASIAPNGNLALAGTYILTDGFYELHYNFLKRKFDIKDGSTIQLAGNPLDAEVDITAAYDAFISPYDLVERQLNSEASQLVYYKQRLPFQVIIHITGKPLKPNITFDIILPDEKANTVSPQVANTVQAKLTNLRNDPSEINKQVFAILILGRFISEDPFNSGTSTSVEYYARQSASRFLSQQLNNIAGKLVKGVELSLDLESTEDYSTGAKENRTDVNIAASKTLFNDRLKVTVGNDFQVEGTAPAGRESSLIPGNLRLDYSLTKDNRYSIGAYRKNELQNVVDGYVVETGGAFKLNYDYNSFRSLFIGRKKRKEIREQRKEMEEQMKKREMDKDASSSSGVSQ